ncbi:MAG: ABC transporter permease [Bacteroidetes bacterium]|nr:ABC transporter permease [Bacteroidota bacterium]
MWVSLRLLKESIFQAINELKVNRLRTFLSLFGVTIGIFCVISVLTVVDNLEKNIQDTIQKFGENVIFIQKWPIIMSDEYPWWKYWKRPDPKYAELKTIQDRSRAKDYACIIKGLGRKTVKFENNSLEGINFSAVSYEYVHIYDLDFQQGRFFSTLEDHTGSNRVIIGNDVALNLFPDYVDPIGRSIKVNNRTYIVTGVIKKEGDNAFGESNDHAIITNYNCVRKFISENNFMSDIVILVKAKDGIGLPTLREELRGIMRTIHKLKPAEEDDFALNQISMLTNQVTSIFQVINMVGWIVGGFALLVGGFGIANIMFVSVKERTGIIGIKKALGAKFAFVMIEFLTESVILTMIGGIVGLGLVYLLTFVITSIGFEVTLLLNNIIMALLMSGLIGIVAGFVPAFNAAKLDPVVAMRHQ